MKTTISLRRRFFTRTALIALLVMILSMVIVDISYRGELEKSMREKLQLQVFSLLSVIQLSDDVYVPDIMQNPAFNRLGSGYWLVVADEEKQAIWNSLSIVSAPPNLPTSNELGEWRYSRSQIEQTEYFTASYLIAWQSGTDQRQFHLIAGEDIQLLDSTILSFRLWLFGGFFLTTLVLMACQYWGLKGAFSPISDLEKEIARLEKGEQHHVKGEYPQELNGFTKNLNALIDMEHKHRERYRSGMADLAHSLKTPLAVILAEMHKYSDNEGMITAVERINTNIEYQLRRAVIADHQLQTRGTHILQVVESVVKALKKIHKNHAMKTRINVEPNLCFWGDENDLTEVLGNLLDNAFKYAKENIQISAHQNETEIVVQVEDDGPGLPEENALSIFSRGERLDDQGLGQGIGLAVVYDIVRSYQGQIFAQRSSLGGAVFNIRFPSGI